MTQLMYLIRGALLLLLFLYKPDVNGVEAQGSGDDINECDTNSHNCDGNSTCINEQGSFRCECNSGYSGDGKSGNCEDINECDTNSHNCDGNSTCINEQGSFRCECNSGYSGDGKSGNCEDINECTNNQHGCYENERCINEIGSHRCLCKRGYYRNSKKCTDVDECTTTIRWRRHDCDNNAQCTNTIGSFSCSCNPGYTGDGRNGSCTDINECLTGQNGCRQNSKCLNTVGSYRCPCNGGYVEVRGTCTDVNECRNTENNCHKNGICNNNEGSFTCSCKSGFSGDGRSCTDIDECETSSHNCGRNARCTNAMGSFLCRCISGYSGDGRRGNCRDVNECSRNQHNCNLNARCNNTPGSFTCTCNAGYTGNGVNCRDIDECSTGLDNCDENAKCSNTIGSFRCTCNSGYSGNGREGNCADIDECRTRGTQNGHNCSLYANCLNSPAGSFTCRCRQGYTGNGVDCTGIIEIDSEPAVTVDQGENINLSYNIAFVRDRVSCELTSKSISLQTFNLNSRRSIDYSMPNADGSAVFLLSCTLTIDGNTFRKNFQTTVTVQVPANIQLSASSIEVMRNSTTPVVVSCISDGNPRPTVMWLKNDKVISDRSGKFIYQELTEINDTASGSDLILTKARYRDKGTYTCTATNVRESGESKDSVNLEVTVKGAPEIHHPVEYVVLPQNNKVEFTCTFDGYPQANVTWSFADGSSLPLTSQFEVSDNVNGSRRYRVSKILTVYGTQCKETSLLSYRCSAMNDNNLGNSAQSDVFAVGIGNDSLTYDRNPKSCRNAVKFCKSHGELVAVSTQAVLNKIRAVTRQNYWISAKSAFYWPGEVSQNVDGCVRIFRGNNRWSRFTDVNSSPLCEATRYAVQPSIGADPVVCDGRKLNISWTILPGATSFPHQIQVYLLSDVSSLIKAYEVQPGVQNLLIMDLKPRNGYFIQILPLFMGCENAPLRGGRNAITGRGNLTAPHRIELTFNQSADTCTLSWPSVVKTGQDEEIGYVDIKITQFINSARSNTLNFADVNVTSIEKSRSNYVISNLNPNTDYQVEVGVVASSPCHDLIPTAWSDPVCGTCVTSPSIPTKVELSSIPPTTKGNLVMVSLAPVSERNGDVSCYFVVVQTTMAGENVTVESDISKLVQADSDPVDGQPYIAMALQRFDEEMEINLGDGSLTCCDVASLEKVDCTASIESRKRRETSTIIRAQNRPLPTDTNVTYYTLTSTPDGNNALYTTSPRSGPIVVPSGEQQQQDLGYIAAIVIAIFLFLLILILLYIMYRRRMWIFKKHVENGHPLSFPMRSTAPVQQNDSFSSDSDIIVVNPAQANDGLTKYDIQPTNILDVYVSKRKSDDFIFMEEFKTSLAKKVRERSLPTTCAKRAENIKKNRFKNISPIDDARVKLTPLPDQPQSDYINASFIDGYSQTAKFIAAQGPKPNTVNDFWRMVFEQRCKVIVMVTQLKEGPMTKCEKYWPEPGEDETFGDILVRTNNELPYGDFICRYLSAQSIKTKEVIAVTHFQYVTWPDHGIPPTTTSLLRLHQAAINAQTGSAGPLLVHCSAGVGRTGTFIALDILSEQLEHEGKINVFETVYEMRQSRTEMVQSLAQYVYIHKLLAEMSMFGNTNVDVSDFPRYEANLNIMDRTTRTTALQIQFSRLGEVPPSFTETSSASKPVNKNLNVFPGILPYDNNLAFVGMTSDDKEVPYINGSNIPTYNAGYHFIIAQDPVPANIHLFWRCVIDNKIKCIVMLDEGGGGTRYWTDYNEAKTFEDVTVRTTNMEEFSGCVERSIEVLKAKEKDPYVVKQIELKNWPAHGIPPSTNTLLETISVVEKCRTDAREVRGKKFLALVHCRDGSSQAGVFCAVSNLVERLKNENCVDVFRTVKDIRDLRQGAIGNIELYKYCYQAVNEFLESFDLYGNFK
ncbi:unnamed protein product [Clavelina lepadiformis]|uniref:protein-tyrosine-phosphatase n=1 Tax=Clavelina lepadiformis TaxID=159417 RepID=A0ABP0FI22_CLALP